MVVQEDLGNEVEPLQQNSQEESFTEGFSSRMVEQAAFNRLSWVSKKMRSKTVKHSSGSYHL